MGVFDQTTLKYNDAIPNPDPKDGVDLVKCDNISCKCRDINGNCLYETCMINVQGVKYHTDFTHKCQVCGNIYSTDTIDNVPWTSLDYFMCPTCLSKISKLVGDIDE